MLGCFRVRWLRFGRVCVSVHVYMLTYLYIMACMHNKIVTKVPLSYHIPCILCIRIMHIMYAQYAHHACTLCMPCMQSKLVTKVPLSHHACTPCTPCMHFRPLAFRNGSTECLPGEHAARPNALRPLAFKNDECINTSAPWPSEMITSYP